MNSTSSIVQTEGYSIYRDELKKIRIKFDNPSKYSELVSKATEVLELVNEIDNLPLDDNEIKKYDKNISNIFQIALIENTEMAKKYGENLKNEIEKNLIRRKQKELYLPSIVALIAMTSIIYVLKKNSLIGEVGYALIYGSIGGIMSMLVQNREIDYKVEKKILQFEGFKLVLLCNIMAIVGYIVIKSKVVLGNIDLDTNQYLQYIIYFICGYSQTFIPNILKNFEMENLQK